MDARTDIRDLIGAARRGEPDAIGKLFEAARGQLLHLAERELPDDLRAKIAPSDVVQETAVDMHRDFVQFNGTTFEELFAWLRETLRHNVVDAVRHYRDSLKRDVAREVSLSSHPTRRHGTAVAGPAVPPDGSAIRREEAASLNEVLDRMSPEDRHLLQLRYRNGLSFVAMAPLLGRSPDAVRKQWYRALARLRAELAAATAGRPAESGPAIEPARTAD